MIVVIIVATLLVTAMSGICALLHWLLGFGFRDLAYLSAASFFFTLTLYGRQVWRSIVHQRAERRRLQRLLVECRPRYKTQRVIYRDLRKKLGGHSQPHPERNKLP